MERIMIKNISLFYINVFPWLNIKIQKINIFVIFNQL